MTCFIKYKHLKKLVLVETLKNLVASEAATVTPVKSQFRHRNTAVPVSSLRSLYLMTHSSSLLNFFFFFFINFSISYFPLKTLAI
ncbi:hypothetical protein QVD17_14508 [Tagetes erecta]|uniref:Uncharacterized protein n=1 Tax=Tagetes erecta TaxID=13708 RepID=A0AAD8P3U3_TARER|nr:hypothetical protein QVD17_14508 [Tagetes erecta]